LLNNSIKQLLFSSNDFFGHGYYYFAERTGQPQRLAVGWTKWCTPGMGVSLWGESPLYVNRLSELVLSPSKETRILGGVGTGGENPPVTRLGGKLPR